MATSPFDSSRTGQPQYLQAPVTRRFPRPWSTGTARDWGYTIQNKTEALRGFKTLLFPDDGAALELYSGLLAALKMIGKLAEQVTGDFLHVVWQHVERQISRSLSDSWHTTHDLKVIITMHYHWSEFDESRMLKAVRLASIPGQVALVLEAEAATYGIFQYAHPSLEVSAPRAYAIFIKLI